MPHALDILPQLHNFSGGQTQAEEPPGFAVLASPRKTARGREHDTLLLALGLRSRGPAPTERYSELLDLAAATFFGTPGSVTAALRQALAAVNQRLLDLNLKAGSQPVQGGLLGAVLRGGDFYAVHCGPGLLLVARGLGVERFPATAGRPLGLSNTLDLHYFHTAVSESEYICLSPSAPPGWNETALAGLGSLATVSHVAERLKATAGADVSVMVGRFEVSAPVAGPSPSATSLRGGLSALLRARAEPPVIPAAPPVAEAMEPPALQPEPEPELQPAPRAATDWKELLRRSERLGQADPTPKVPVLEEAPPIALEPEEEEAEAAPRPNLFAPLGERVTHGLRSAGRALSVTLAEANQFVRKLIARALPEGTLQKEGVFAVPTSVQIGIAVLMPFVFVALAWALWVQEGNRQRFSDALLLAQAAAARAEQTTDPAALRAEWETAQSYLAQAQSVKPDDPQVLALQQQAQAQLDALDNITRLAYKPLVVGGLGPGVKVKRVAAIGAGQATVYALDETNNRILRLAPTANLGYAIDRNFACGGGRVGTVNIGPLLDMLAVPDPRGFGKETVVAMDTTGAVMYCPLTEAPSANYLVAPPTSWVRPIAIDYYAATRSLYVLDAGQNQIWQYPPSGDNFTLSPEPYFATGQYNLSDVIDFAITEIDGAVFLLYRDGHMSICSRAASGQAATCQENAPFGDERPGRTSGPQLQDVTAPLALASSRRMSVPSLYLVDGETAGVYNLGLKLTLFAQYRPSAPLRDPVTALALDDVESLYLAAGDNVYVHVTSQ